MCYTAPVDSRRLRLVLLYPLYLLACLMAVHYFVFWRPFIAALRLRSKPPSPALRALPYLDELAMQRLGFIQTDRQRSFVNFPETKTPGTVRICCVGDSFTYGGETVEGYDYPTILEEKLRGDGFDRIEVINFGSSWHGFHQSYLLWDAVGRHFDCDYVLLGPQSFQYDRDTTSNHSKLTSPYYLHAHYVVDGDDVRLIEVPGVAYDERFAEYYRFLPRWQYVRYDRNLPATIQAILPARKTLPNLLHYYPGSMAEEGLATYKALLRRLSLDGPQIVLLHDNRDLLEVARSLDRPNLVPVESYITYHFPYRAPDGHYSPFGNQLVAEQFAAQLVEGGDDRLCILESSDPPPPPPSVATTQPLSSFESVEVRYEENAVGVPVETALDWGTVAVGSATGLKGGGVTSLFTVKDPETPLIDANFIGLDFPLRQDMQVTLRSTGGVSAREVSLGTLRLLDPRVNIGFVDLAGVWPSEREGFTFPGNPELPLRTLGPTGDGGEMLLDGRPVLRGNIGPKGIRLTPLSGEFVTFRVGESQFLPMSALPDSGRFDLVLEQPLSGAIRVPFAMWRKTTVPMPRAGRTSVRALETRPP